LAFLPDPITPIQLGNQLIGGKEGILPTNEQGKIFGIFEPTITKEAESISSMFGNNTSQDEQVNELMPEEAEQFEQQGRL
jgi:hypothetical protein